MKLHNDFRSSASFRVRIALELKGLPYEYVPVHLVKGEHKQEAYAAISPSGLVPTLVTDDGDRLVQSMATIEYLDATHPEPPLLPRDSLARGRYCLGDMPTLADCCLVPQVFNGRRFNVDFSGLDRTMAAFDACMQHPAFQKAQPSNCPDNEP